MIHYNLIYKEEREREGEGERERGGGERERERERFIQFINTYYLLACGVRVLSRVFVFPEESLTVLKVTVH